MMNSTPLNIIFSVTNSNCLAQYPRVVSPTLNVNPILFVIPCKFFGGLQCCNYCHLLSDFSSKFQSSMTILYYINVRVYNIPTLFQWLIQISKFETSIAPSVFTSHWNWICFKPCLISFNLLIFFARNEFRWSPALYGDNKHVTGSPPSYNNSTKHT